jgi:cytochrome c oxidase subunit 2
LIYALEKTNEKPDVLVKVISSQWLWSYEYASFINEKGKFIKFDSTLIQTPQQFKPHFLDLQSLNSVSDNCNTPSTFVPLMEVDNRLVLPVGLKLKVIATSTDVIHS